MKDLTSVSKEEQQRFFDSFDQILSDVDGVVLWHLQKQVPGTEGAIKCIRKFGKRVTFVTNNCTKPFSYFTKQLRGFECIEEDDELITPTLAIVDFLKTENIKKEIYVIGMTVLKSDLKNAGFKISDEPPSNIHEAVVTLLEHTKDNEDVGAVVIDADVNLNYVKLQKAVSYLRRPDVTFISGATDHKLAFDPKTILLGPGYFLDSIEHITGRKAHALAKPSVELNKYIVERLKIQDTSRVLFIGDSIPEDMAFASNCGYKKLLVLSGLSRKEDLSNWTWPEKYKPDYYVNSIKDLKDIIEKNLQNKL